MKQNEQNKENTPQNTPPKPPQFCMFCDNEACYVIVETNAGLCSSCKEAYEYGQINSDAEISRI